MAASQENLYVTARIADIYMKPDDKSEVLANVVLGDEVHKTGSVIMAGVRWLMKIRMVPELMVISRTRLS